MKKKLEIESQKIKAELILAEKRLEMERKDREEKMELEKLETQRKLELEAEKTAEESKRLNIQIQLDNEFRHSESQRTFEMKKSETEMRERIQQEVSARESETQIRVAEIQASASSSNTNMSGNNHNNSNLSCKQIRDLPALRSTDREQIDNYFSHFIRLCTLNKIPEDSYCLYIAPKLPEDLLKILTRMSTEDGRNFELFRENINRKFLLNGDYYCTKFYALNLEPGDSNSEYIRKLSEIFEKWLNAEQVKKDYNSLFEFFISQQYYRKIPTEKAIFLKEHAGVPLDGILSIADTYDIAHLRDPNRRKVFNFNSFGQHNNNSTMGNINPRTSNSDKLDCSICGKKNHTAETCFSKRPQTGNKSELSCSHCHKKGHVKEKCYAIHGKPSVQGNPRSGPQVSSTFKGKHQVAAVQICEPKQYMILKTV